MVDTKNLKEVSAYLEDHKDAIVQLYNAVGIGIGKLKPSDKSYILVVYLQDNQDLPALPVVLDNIPVKFVVTGTFHLHK